MQRVSFLGSQGVELAARLDLPMGPVKAYAVFVHCFTCSKDVFAASCIAAGLTESGWGVLRFDFTGLGSSDGDFANSRCPCGVKRMRLWCAAGGAFAMRSEPIMWSRYRVSSRTARTGPRMSPSE